MWKEFLGSIENEPMWNSEIYIKCEGDDSTIEKVFYGSEPTKNVNNLPNIIGSKTHRKQLNEYQDTKKRLCWSYKLEKESA